MAHTYHVVILHLLFLISLSHAKICPGTENRFSFSGDSKSRYEGLKKRYKGCTVVEGNLEINKIYETGLDWSFLSSIREITGYLLIMDTSTSPTLLTNLTIIRGNTRLIDKAFSPNEFSLLIANNDGRGQPLALISLREVSSGDILVHNNKICNLYDVLWKDIKDGPITNKENSNNCQPCSSECEEVQGKKHCWGPNANQCQKFIKAICSKECSNGCYGKNANECCSPVCAAGCSGPTNMDCRACKTITHEGACYKDCVITKNKLTKGLLEYKNQCFDTCPAHLFTHKPYCVATCPDGFEAKRDNLCEPCNPCAKKCTIGKYVDFRNIESLRGCVHLTDSLMLHSGSFASVRDLKPLSRQQLEILVSIETIGGYLVVGAAHPNLKDLSFLKNLKSVKGNVLWEGICSVVIYSTDLESIGLNNLNDIGDGKFCLLTNKKLCYVANANWKAAFGVTDDQILMNNNKEHNSCVNEGKICHAKCSSDGCQGPLETDCIKCRSGMGNKCTN